MVTPEKPKGGFDIGSERISWAIIVIVTVMSAIVPLIAVVTGH